jgi:hypothetical protein
LVDLYPVELAIYEKVVASEHVEPRKLLPREELIRTMTLDEIASIIVERKELETRMTAANNPPKAMKELKEEIREVDDYKVLVENHGDLAPLVLRILNRERLEDQLQIINMEVNEPDSFIDAYLPVRVILEKTVHDLNTPVKEACISDVTEGLLSDAKQDVNQPDLTAMNLANDLSVGRNELKTAKLQTTGNILQCRECTKKVVQILSCGHSSYCRNCLLKKKESDMKCPTCAEYIYGTMAILGSTLPAQEIVAVVDTQFPIRIQRMDTQCIVDCHDEALPTSVEDRSKNLGKEEYFYQECYLCTLPTFIWRALNSHGCSALPAPRNWCMLESGGTIQVDLIANKDWRRYGVDVERGRIAFAFKLEVFRNKNRYTLDIGVWENSKETTEWEIGPIFSLGKFNIACDAMNWSAPCFPRPVDSTKTHPLFVLLRRVVQVMTGKQYGN